MRRCFLPYSRQHIGIDDVRAVTEALESEYITRGPRVLEFERKFADTVGARHAIAVSSGTAALHLAMRALNIGPKDTCIVPTITFVGTANAVRFCQAGVIFADVDPSTGLATVETFAQAAVQAKGRTIRAFVPVHIGGQTACLPEIANLAVEHNALVIEDACHALGTRTGRPGSVTNIGSCSHSIMAAFSFHAVKTITCGEGGMITTNEENLAVRLRRERDHGVTRDPEQFGEGKFAFDSDGSCNPWFYEMQELGFNYHLTDFQSALGLSQLAKLDWFARRRRELAAIYDRNLVTLAPIVQPLAKVPGCDPVLHLYVVRIDFEGVGLTRAKLMRQLFNRGIGTQVHYIPVHRQPYYVKLNGRQSLPGAEAYYASCLSLPLYPDMSDQDPVRVTETLAECLTLS